MVARAGLGERRGVRGVGMGGSAGDEVEAGVVGGSGESREVSIGDGARGACTEGAGLRSGVEGGTARPLDEKIKEGRQFSLDLK